jgi:hypothetical protein
MEIFITYTVFSLMFTLSETLKGPVESGFNSQTFIYEVNEKEFMSISFVLFTQENQENMQMNDTELLNYAKTTFFGTSKPAESFKERIILGKISNGELLTTKIPVASDIEMHIVTPENGEKYCIGFKSIKEMPEAIKSSLINNILGSLKYKSD